MRVFEFPVNPAHYLFWNSVPTGDDRRKNATSQKRRPGLVCLRKSELCEVKLAPQTPTSVYQCYFKFLSPQPLLGLFPNFIDKIVAFFRVNRQCEILTTSRTLKLYEKLSLALFNASMHVSYNTRHFALQHGRALCSELTAWKPSEIKNTTKNRHRRAAASVDIDIVVQPSLL